MVYNIVSAEHSRLYAETKTLSLNDKQVAMIRAVLERRARTFIGALESECQTRIVTGGNGKAKRMGVSVFAWEED